MDQISHSKYPSTPSSCTTSALLFTTGVSLFIGAPINYIFIGNAEQALIITAYSLFFFFASSIANACCSSEDND